MLAAAESVGSVAVVAASATDAPVSAVVVDGTLFTTDGITWTRQPGPTSGDFLDGAFRP